MPANAVRAGPLFYQKPQLANTSEDSQGGDVPAFLSGPDGDVWLGLPAQEPSWRDETTSLFDLSLSYSMVSWPERHEEDRAQIVRQQVYFLVTMLLNLGLATAFLCERWIVKTAYASTGGELPGPFQPPPGNADASSTELRHFAVVLAVGALGAAAALSLSPAGLSVYLSMVKVFLIVGAGAAAAKTPAAGGASAGAAGPVGAAMAPPNVLFACRFLLDAVLVFVGRGLLERLTCTWIHIADRRHPT